MKNIVAVFLLCLFGVSMQAHAAKPRSPLLVEVVPVQTANPVPGQAVDLNIVITTALDTNELRLRLETRGGVSLASGSAVWVGPAAKGEVKHFQISVRLPSSGGGSVRALATISQSQTATFSTAAEYHFNRSAREKPQVMPRQGVNLQGRQIREYRE